MPHSWHCNARGYAQVHKIYLLVIKPRHVFKQNRLRLGFDHEHSRLDRDQHISIFLNNTNKKLSANFEKNLNPQPVLDTPYDFYSVTHYDSDALQINSKSPTILSKIPALISDNFELFHKRETLSPIDIHKVQSLYKCKVITIPTIAKEEDSIEEEILGR
jgi:hypothetical protein